MAGLVSFNAAADELGEPGQISLGAERLFGVNFGSVKVEADGGAESTTSATDIGLLFNGGGPTPYTIPRLALDYFVADGVSIGGSLGFTSHSGENESKLGGTTTSTDHPSVTSFAIAPRVGYVIPLTDGVDLWARGGITYWQRTTEGDPDDTKDSGLGLGLEGLFVISPIEGFGISIGPTIDFGLSGSTEVGDADADLTATNFGLNAGLVGWF
ncbi:MAG: outer membrane beta-barrel protein [Polyangiaceae bacterium]|nr:outer membrane beta-barrel protein [Polyangiaceae bacterium]MCW5790403.1 outer membrane beta-barrel protein [Polyangiaceae bacterium]